MGYPGQHTPWTPGQTVLQRMDVIKALPNYRRRGVGQLESAQDTLRACREADEAILRATRQETK